jgi:oligosaccharide 4-alpha-D-glucosyltransferase
MRYLLLAGWLLISGMALGQGAGSYMDHSIDTGVVTIETTEGVLELKLFSKNIIQSTFKPEDVGSRQLSNAVIMEPEHVEMTASIDNDKKLRICWQENERCVEVMKDPIRLRYLRNGNILVEELTTRFEDSTHAGIQFRLRPNEKIMGAGFRALPMDRRRHSLGLYNKPQYGYGMGAADLNFSIPYVQSSEQYGLFVDNPQKGYVDIGKADTNVMEWGFIGGEMSYYVIMDESWEGIMQSYSKLTGTQPLPPRWALGNVISRFGYESEAEARQMVNEMKDRYFPLDAIVIDLFWFGKGVKDSFYMGNLRWDTTEWPHPEKMISDFREKGVKTALITEPYIETKSNNWEYCAENDLLATDSAGNPFVIKDFFFGHAGLLDIFKPEVQDWFWQQYDRQIEKGITGWWGDLGEPETHPGEIHHAIGTANEVHNIYGHYWSKMLFDKYAENYPDRRLFHLNRSGYAGSQRYSVYPWSGDVSRSWSGFKAQMPVMLGMGLCGIPFMHSDLGGFAMGIKDERLYTRWLQMGTFNPIYRPHGSGIPSEPIFFSDSVQQIVRKYINLRYRMIPYNYTLAWKAHTEGMPMVRPLFFEEPGKDTLYNIHDIYLWGDHFLVAPVVDSGATERRLYLPEGEWYSFFTDQKYEGGRWITVPVELENIPVFVNAGSIIPFAPPTLTTDKYVNSNVQLAIYAGEEGVEYTYTQYEDDGKSMAYEDGHYELITYRAMEEEGVLRITTSATGQRYQGQPPSRDFTISITGGEHLEKIIFGDIEYNVLHPGEERKNLNNAYYNSKSGKIHIRTR